MHLNVSLLIPSLPAVFGPLAAAIFGLIAPALPAATINWTLSTVSGPSDVSTAGALVGAMNVGTQTTDGLPAQVLNGVSFAPDPGGAGTLPLGTATVQFSFADNFDNDFWSGAAPGGSAEYNTALDYGRSSDGGSRSGTVTLGGLVSGRTYQVQLWIVDTRTAPYDLRPRVRTVNGTATTAGGPNIATGTFTADAAAQVITITGTTGDSITPHGPQLNLLQLRDVTPIGPITVTSAADSGPGTLRAAIEAANAAPGPDSISFSPVLRGQTITLGSDPLVVTDTAGLTINGELVTLQRTIVTGNRMILVINGARLTLHNASLKGSGGGVDTGGAIFVTTGATLEMSNSTLWNHRTLRGAGIENAGTATLSNCTLTGNSASWGGAIANLGGTLRLTHCTLSANIANGTDSGNDGGGAIDSYNNGTLHLLNCILAQNTASTSNGPDLWMEDGTVSARHCFIGNGKDSTLVDGSVGTKVANRVGSAALPIIPQLAPLGYYGTRGTDLPPTMPPLPGSPVIGIAAVVPGADTEQGGSPRGLGLWTNDFSTGLNGAVARGSGTLSGSGPDGDFRLTLELPSQNGSISLPVVPSMEQGFHLTFDYLFNAASGPADGISVCWGQDPGHVINNAGDGVTHKVRFDIYNGGGGGTGRIFYQQNGTQVGAANTTALNRFDDKGRYYPVSVRLFPGGRLVVTYKGITVVDVNTGYTHAAGDRIMIGSGTGGLMALQVIDNIGVRTGPAGYPDLGAAQTLTTNNPTVARTDDADSYAYTRTADGSVRGFSLRQAVRWAYPFANITIDPVVNGSGIALRSEINLGDRSRIPLVTIDASGLPGGFTLDAGGTANANQMRRHFSVPSNHWLSLQNLTLTNGRASGTTVNEDGWGGAISVASGGTLFLSSCTLHDNTSYRGGGAINNGGTAYLRRCTIAQNFTTLGNSSEGGAMRNSGTMEIIECTVAQNSSSPGAIYNAATGQVTCTRSLLANTEFGGWNIRNLGAFGYVAANLSTGSINNSGTVNGSPTLTGNPLLAPLGHYGGPTKTMALRPGSPARDAAPGASVLDQRGFPLVGIADLGAYEAGTFTNCNAWLWETLPSTLDATQLAPWYDLDGDGATNEQEWAARTDPNNATSHLRITSIVRRGSELEITFLTISGRTYTLWQTDDLISPWVQIQPASLSAVVGRMTFFIPAPADSIRKRFYRVQTGP